MNEQEQATGVSDPAETTGPAGVDVASGTEDVNTEQAAGAGETDEAAVEKEVNAEPVDELTEARREIEVLKDSWSRERAEFQNFKRRTASDMARMKIQAAAQFATGLLPVLDNLDTVLKVKTDNEQVLQFLTGVQMIQREFLTVLERNNIRSMDPADQVFDPNVMEAIATEPREGLTTETVIEVFQEGLVMEFEDGHKQVLRPARVKVGTPIQGDQTNTDNQQ